jgi:ubiquinone/menaquinone biosynthesis C-methylase UbiE
MSKEDLIKFVVGSGERPKDWWGNPDNAILWIEQNARKEADGNPKLNTTLQSTDMVVAEIKRFAETNNIKSILEVGAGSGRLIGELSKQFSDVKCYSVDINSELSKYVKEHFPDVETSVGEIIDLPFKDNSFDLVYTYQVLQHVEPGEIEKALSELIRVSNNQVWMWEGYNPEYPNGFKRHKAHNGAFAWRIDEIIPCYEKRIPRNDNISLKGQRMYKFKKN